MVYDPDTWTGPSCRCLFEPFPFIHHMGSYYAVCSEAFLTTQLRSLVLVPLQMFWNL